MARASEDALTQLEPLLMELRTLNIIEKSRGIFYTKRGAFLHFHEDDGGVWADLKYKDRWERFASNTKSDFKKIFALAKAQL